MYKGKIMTRAQLKIYANKKTYPFGEPLKKSKKTKAIKKFKKIKSIKKKRKKNINNLINPKNSLNISTERTHNIHYDPQTGKFVSQEDFKNNPDKYIIKKFFIKKYEI